MVAVASVPPGAGYGCLLIDNRGVGAISGTFAGLPEGTIFGPPNARFRISYIGGDGNDVMLRRVEVPPTIDVSSDDRTFGDAPTTVLVWVGGDTPTALAAPGTVTVSLDGAVIGTFPLQYSQASVPLGTLAEGTHVVTVTYSGGTYAGELTFLPRTVEHMLSSKARPIVSLPGGGGQLLPPGATPPTASPPSAPPAPPSADPGPGPVVDEPSLAAIRAGLRAIDRAVITPRQVRFTQTVHAPGPIRGRLALGTRARRQLLRTPRLRLVLETILTTGDGRKVVARAPLR